MHIKTRMVNTLYLLLAVLMLGSIKNGFCQHKESRFEERPFLMAINRPEDSLAYQYLNMIYSEVFRRLEIPLEMKYLPLKRGVVEVTSGKLDGETTRVRAYEDTHPTLIRVKEYLYRTNVSAFTANPYIGPLNGWNSLRGSNYKVEYPRGVLISEINLNKVVNPLNLSSVTKTEQALKKLLLHRTDIFIGDDLVVFPLMQGLQESYHGEIRKLGVMQSVPLYMYIHQKNYSLEPRLSEVIKEIKEEGLIEAYRNIVFNF